MVSNHGMQNAMTENSSLVKNFGSICRLI